MGAQSQITQPNNLQNIATMNSTAHTVGWASEPEGRGTIGLLWSCFATLFLCTWSAVHPNLPGPNQSQFAVLWKRTQYVLICLIGPETMVWHVLMDLRSAVAVKRKIPAWSLKKCFFLTMGGFVVRFPDGQRRRVRPEVLVELLQEGKLSWPDTTNEEIEDHSKSNWLIKAFALIQIISFIAQLVGRCAQGLAATTLELFTLGIVICAVVIYAAWWEKPFDVQTPIILPCDRIFAEQDFIDRVAYLDEFDGSDNMSGLLWYSSMIIISLAFGAVHIVAWNFHFPSPTEQLLWRISSIGVTTVPVLIVLMLMEEDIYKRILRRTLWDALFWPFAISYTLFRLYMFIEMFISLRASPSSVYQTPQWSQYFPSFG
ncbi:hypothetical protein HBH64_141750 [Parastagonospora nodorum]|nr:hypothetical protein HBH47_125480 [Parastagonospora nodorum]KAH4220624.1 hypothetical protein HBI06_170230 [Parastagonospora nodorum]KAH4237536.1 hypothetical protein HBI05_132670 [Parastagonospora nodorum]KAH4285912.1 hypothetical protein HBI01_247000 [Parastagonospora nodorum]KAH4315671.1 hypothetical protein HBI02_048890 [Parastagonospora nodorum]